MRKSLGNSWGEKGVGIEFVHGWVVREEKKKKKIGVAKVWCAAI